MKRSSSKRVQLFSGKFAVLAYEYLLKPEGRHLPGLYGYNFCYGLRNLSGPDLVSMLAYALYRTDFKYRRDFVSCILHDAVQRRYGSWYLVCTQILHLKNTIWALILPMVMSSWNVILMRIFLIHDPYGNLSMRQK